MDNGSPTLNLSSCPQVINVVSATTCNQLSQQYQFPTAGLGSLNYALNCPRLENTTVCAPESCPIAVVQVTGSITGFLTGYTNFTWTQFISWNPSINTRLISAGEAVCVGPPGGFYTPTSVVPAQPTVYTTTANATHPTASGTILNCGRFYTVQSGDYCNSVALKFSITFSDLINMNPSIDSACSNLIAGNDYCVALVNGTTVTPVTSTATPKNTTSTSGGSPSSSLKASSSSSSSSGTTTSTVTKTTTATTTTTTTTTNPTPTPTPTQSGMVANCKKFYKAVGGDGCYDIAQRNGITPDTFVSWNPAVKSGCSGLYADYYYCVGT